MKTKRAHTPLSTLLRNFLGSNEAEVDDLKKFRKWLHNPPLRASSPLIIDGLAMVQRTILDTQTCGLAHGDGAAMGPFVEQWLLFGADPSPRTLIFAAQQETITIDVAPAPYPKRLPWPFDPRPTAPHPTVFLPVPDGGQIAAQAFFDGIKASAAASDSYAWAQMTVTPLAAGQSPPLGNDTRGYEELWSNPLDPTKTAMVYAETTTWDSALLCFKTRTHVAWSTFVLPGAGIAHTVALPDLNRSHAQWCAAVQQANVANAYKYAVGEVRYYPNVPSTRPT